MDKKYDPVIRKVLLTSKEGRRNQKLGRIGEELAFLLLTSSDFTNVVNLNTVYPNFPFADFVAERNKTKFLISVKARNKYENTGKLNSRFKLGDTDKKIQLVQSIKEICKYSVYTPAFMAIALDENTFDAYFGLIENLPNRRGIPMSKKAVSNYEAIALNQPHSYKYSEFQNCYNLKEGSNDTI